MPLKEFRILLANQLISFQRLNPRGRPRSSGGDKTTPPKPRQLAKKSPQVPPAKDKNGNYKEGKGSTDSKHAPAISVPPSIRYDDVGHFPVTGAKGRCRLCTTGQTVWQCTKCQTRACLKPEKIASCDFTKKLDLK